MHRTNLFLAAGLAAALLVGASTRPGIAGSIAGEPQFTDHFPLAECTFKHNGSNRYMSLQPGYQQYLEGDEDGVTMALLKTVLNKTHKITFAYEGQKISVKTRVVEERHFQDSELVEVSRNFMARCKETGDIYYFGEEVDIYEDGKIIGHDGAWIVGEDGALPGVLMPGSFLLGSRYFQEVAPGIAQDRAEHVEMDVPIHTPAGTFQDCIVIHETSPLNPAELSVKAYCPEVGLVQDDVLFLVSFGFPNGNDDDDDNDDDD